MAKPLHTLLVTLICCVAAYSAHAANYYWVGGSGNWSDYANHWATTSGGGVFHTGVPDPLDDVYFDANSFTAAGQTVVIDSPVVSCRDMDWSGATNAPTLVAADLYTQLKVYGSLTLNPAMSFMNNFKGTLIFTAVSAGKTITTAGVVVGSYVEFNGPGGEWTLQDSLTFILNRGIKLLHGTLRTNNQKLSLYYLESDNSNVRALYLGTSTVVITGSSSAMGNGWHVSNTLTLDAANSIIRFVGNVSSTFESEGHNYNIVEWKGNYPTCTSPFCLAYHQMKGNGFTIRKLIGNSSYGLGLIGVMNIVTNASTIDTIIANSNVHITGTGNRIQSISAAGNVLLTTNGSLPRNTAATITGAGITLNGAVVQTATAAGNSTVRNSRVGSISIAGTAMIEETDTISHLSVQGKTTFTAVNISATTVDTAVLNGNADFLSDSNHFSILDLQEGNTYTFGAGKTQTIDSLIIEHSAGATTQLLSSNLGTAANVVISGMFCADHLYIHSIHASGSNRLYAGANSLDIGNNTGWIFAPCGCAITGSAVICSGSTVFTASGGVSYGWIGPAGFTASTASTGAIQVAGVYTVTVTDSAGGTSSCSRTLTVYPLCNDGDICTIDSCTASGCIYPANPCDDGNLCTVDTCNSVSGCGSTPVSCDDFNLCTIDACNPLTGCFTDTLTILCDDGDVCTIDGCIDSTGCITTPLNCDDADACTADNCAAGTGCVNTAIVCDDGDVCTTDACGSAGCTYTPLTCDDADACTADACNAGTGCANTAIVCDDNDVCTTDGCDVLAGCTTTSIVCDDADACTTDGCDPVTGCSFTPIVLQISFNVTNATCATCSDGVATAQVTNGTPPFTYTWFTAPVQTTPAATGLAAGAYTLCASDANGCANCDTATVLADFCSAAFDLYPDTVPHQYYVVNNATGMQPFTYSWNWGDGSTDTGAFPIHAYDTAGHYTICLTITDSAGCTDTYCNPYFLLKTPNAMITVMVVGALPTAISEPILSDIELYPNPTASLFTVKAKSIEGPVSLRLFDAVGRLVWAQTAESNVIQDGMMIDLSGNSEGIYLLHLQSESGSRVVKVVRY